METKIGDTVAFLPLRKGSKSIPLKNIKLINGRPLAYWILDAAVGCDKIDRVVVSTDSQEISETISRYGSSKIQIIGRTEEVSNDVATTESVMLEFAFKYQFDNIVLLQATSPLLTSEYLSQGIDRFKRESLDSVVSVVRQKRFIWEENRIGAFPVNYDPNKRPRRQDFDGFLVENGAFYITSRKQLLETKCRISGVIGIVQMAEESYIELDEPNDWVVVETILKQRFWDSVDIFTKIKNIKCLITDCDGVLTDGGMYYSETGDELKRFNTRDGMGFKLLRENGFKTGVITGEDVELVRRRANKMKLDFIYAGINDKLTVLNNICKEFDLQYDEIAYIGDDINDVDVINAVGLGCAVRDGMDCVKDAADYVTTVGGGRGAVREVVELILGKRKNI